MSLHNRITINPDICHGKPVVRGLRYPVELLLEQLSGGMSQQDLLDDYPDLEAEDISAVLAFAAHTSRVQRIELLAA
jgi:uncharacterized protein (DUF433 family)